jgi:putative hemolysin
MEIAAIVVLLILSGIFSATETAYTSLSVIDQKMFESKRSKSAKLAWKFSKNCDLVLTTVLICNNLTNITLSALVTSMTISKWGNGYVGLATGILTIVLLTFGEITPKQIALHNGRGIALAMAIPLEVLTILLFPFIWLFRNLSKFINFLFKNSDGKKLTTESLIHLTDAAEDEGVVDQYEKGLMHRAIHFSETQAKTIMTHRTEVFCLKDTITLNEAFPKMVESGFSRVPLYHGSQENITGVLLLKDLLKAQVGHTGNIKVTKLSKTPHFVPEQMHIDDLFFQFKHQKMNMAIVLDEYGGFSGVITMEDVVEQLFGEIYDEHEAHQGELITEKCHEEGVFIVQAETPLQMLADKFEFTISDDDEESDSTVAGYLLNQTGDIPHTGEIIDTRFGLFKVLSMTKNRMDTLEYRPGNPQEEE